MPEERVEIIVGVDTHTDTHAAVAIDRQGRRLDVIEIEATPSGYRRLLCWARQLGDVVNGQFAVPGFGQVEVPALRGCFSV